VVEPGTPADPLFSGGASIRERASRRSKPILPAATGGSDGREADREARPERFLVHTSQLGCIGVSQAEGGSRLTNSNNSVNSSTAGISAADETRQIPTPEERIAEFFEEYPERAMLSVARQDGTKLREEYVIEQDEQWQAEAATEREEELGLNPAGEQTTAYDPVNWVEAVEMTLERYEDTRQTTVNLERGQQGEETYAEFSVEAETRWMETYQQRYYAQLNAWIRELTGGDRPSGGTAEASFEDPYVVLLTRSASAVPDGEYIGPVDHANAIRDAWEPTYHTLRNTMRAMGYELGEDWQYERRMEPHKGERGGGTNWCFTHEHTAILVDGEVEAEDFAPVVEKHVDECDPAGADAHDVEEAVEVFPADEMANLAAYVGAYTGIEPTGLLERDIEYVAWAGAMDAANIRTKSRSDAARHAAVADGCKQQYESARSDQDHDHAERVVRSAHRGYEYECAECGSPHVVDQDPDTLTAHRLNGDDSGQTAVADGGRDFEGEREDELREQWQDARAAASVGERPERRKRRQKIEQELRRDPDATPLEVVARLTLPPDATELVEEVRVGYDRSKLIGFERPPSWHVKSVTVGEDEYPASAGNGIEMVELEQSRGERGLQSLRGRETPIGTVRNVCRRFTVHDSTTECAVTGAPIDESEPHLLVSVEGEGDPVPVVNVAVLSDC